MGTIDDLVDISAIEAGTQTLNLEEVNLTKVLEDLVKFFSTQASEKGLFLTLGHPLPKVCQHIQSDRAKLESAVTNLIRNAIQYTNQGSVHVGAYQQENNLTIYVSDTGPGISPDNQNLIFDQFEQVSFTDKEKVNEGSGLGLSIAKAKVEILGGHILLDSADGKGSDFYIRIPVDNTDEQKAPPEQLDTGEHHNRADRVSGKALTVLIAEDDELSYMVLKRTLESRGATVYRAENGKEAVQQVRDRPELDLVMMDIRMPELDGLEATRQIRTFNEDIAIFAQTAYAMEGDQKTALEAGCNNYLTKPINVEVLANKLNEYFPV
jgi:Signal transduction histidine kinase